MVSFPIEYAEVDKLFRSTLGNGLGVVAITGPEGGEGATLLSRTLAERSAVSGIETLLVDLDVANPDIKEVYGLQTVDWFPGCGGVYPAQGTGFSHLSVLASPARSSCRWEFRDLPTLLAMLNDFRKTWQAIIINTSPICRKNQGNIPPDTLCACADGTLLTVLAGRTSETRVREAAECLERVNANLQGCVLNDRFTPSLASELVRETFRLERWFPGFMQRLRALIRSSPLLNQDI